MEFHSVDLQAYMDTLRVRFLHNKHRHLGLSWEKVAARLGANQEKLMTVYRMEATGGEPDVVMLNHEHAAWYWVDCSTESPKDRRSLCYDQMAWLSRKTHKPTSSALEVASELGIEILREAEYKQLQEIECFDKKTSSWLQTPEEIRALGGAIFGDFRFGRVFVYHNGAESYYGSRGFRGKIEM